MCFGAHKSSLYQGFGTLVFMDDWRENWSGYCENQRPVWRVYKRRRDQVQKKFILHKQEVRKYIQQVSGLAYPNSSGFLYWYLLMIENNITNENKKQFEEHVKGGEIHKSRSSPEKVYLLQERSQKVNEFRGSHISLYQGFYIGNYRWLNSYGKKQRSA